jgi:hypothetical protein
VLDRASTDAKARVMRVAHDVIREHVGIEERFGHELANARTPDRDRHRAHPRLRAHRIVGAEVKGHVLIAREANAAERAAVQVRITRELGERRVPLPIELAVLVPRHTRESCDQREDHRQRERSDEDGPRVHRRAES